MTLTFNQQLTIRGDTNDDRMRWVLSMACGVSPPGDSVWKGGKKWLLLPGLPDTANVANRLATGKPTSASLSCALVTWQRCCLHARCSCCNNGNFTHITVNTVIHGTQCTPVSVKTTGHCLLHNVPSITPVNCWSPVKTNDESNACNWLVCSVILSKHQSVQEDKVT